MFNGNLLIIKLLKACFELRPYDFNIGIFQLRKFKYIVRFLEVEYVVQI